MQVQLYRKMEVIFTILNYNAFFDTMTLFSNIENMFIFNGQLFVYFQSIAWIK